MKPTKQQLIIEIAKQLQKLKLPREISPYVDQFLHDCNIHQLQNIVTNLPEAKKHLQLVVKQSPIS